MIGWLIYGTIVGAIAKFLYQKETNPPGWFNQVLIGIGGSYLGGAISYYILGSEGFSPSGLTGGVVGAVLLLMGVSYYRNKKVL